MKALEVENHDTQTYYSAYLKMIPVLSRLYSVKWEFNYE